MKNVNENKTSDVKLVKHFIKDLSFENLQEIDHNSVRNNKGNITLDMNVVYQAYDGDFFSLILNYTFDCISKEKKEKIFHLELDYFGFFKNLNKDDINQKNMTQNGLKLIFPFIKEIIEDITQKGGCGRITLNEIDFDSFES